MVGLLIATPLLARLGNYKELRRWNAPVPNPFGHDRPIYLTVQETHSIFDIFSLYPSQRILVTDGGYAYVLNFETPDYPASRWVQSCDVAWSTNDVTLFSRDGLTIKIDRQAVHL